MKTFTIVISEEQREKILAALADVREHVPDEDGTLLDLEQMLQDSIENDEDNYVINDFTA